MIDKEAILTKALAEQVARAAALEAGADAALLSGYIANRTRVTVDGEHLRITVVDETGNPLIANSRGDAMTPSTFAASLKGDPRFAPAFSRTDEGAKDAAPPGKILTRAQFDDLNPAARQRALARGMTVTD